MKNIHFLLIVFTLLTACKGGKEAVTEVTAGTETLITGEFLLWENAAVLKTETDIYGLPVDEKTQELARQCAPLQQGEFDMIPVTIKGIIKKNPQPESWKEIIHITEILSVSKSSGQETP